MYLNMYVWISIHMHTYIYTYICIHIHADSHLHPPAYLQTYMHTYIKTDKHACIRAHTTPPPIHFLPTSTSWRYVCVYTNVYIPCVYAYPPTHKHTCVLHEHMQINCGHANMDVWIHVIHAHAYVQTCILS